MRRDALIAARKAKKLSQRALAEKAHTTRGLIGDLETGARRPSIVVAFNIAGVLGKRVDQVFPEYKGQVHGRKSAAT